MRTTKRTPYGLSEIVMEHFLNTRNVGPLDDPSGEGWSGSVYSSRFMRIQLRLKNGLIEEARFGTYGCAPAIAAGSFLTEAARGLTVAEARSYTPQRLLKELRGLPESRRYCADMAVEALNAALDDALSRSVDTNKPDQGD